MDTTFANFTNNTPENVYAGSAEKEIHTLNEEQAKKYDTNRQATDALDIMFNNLPVEERNNPIKAAAIQQHKADIADLISRGDYQNASLLVQKMAKDFKMDNQLQGALQSQQLKSQYEQDLQDRLRGYSEQVEKNSDGSVKEVKRNPIPESERITEDMYNFARKEVKRNPIPESERITEDMYNFARKQDKTNNVDSVKYNPKTGQVENMFKGTTLVGDKSKEIYDKMYSRLDKFKEDGIMYANGHTYTTGNLRNSEYVLEDGKQVRKEELYNALKQEVEGTPQYMDYINQTKNIRKFNTLTNTDGTKRTFDINDFKGYTQDEIKAAANNGISQAMIDNYNKSNEDAYRKKQIDKSTYENTKFKIKNQQDNYNKVDINNPDTLDKAWNREQHNDILNSLVNPAADAGAHILPEHKIFQDNTEHDITMERYKDRMKNIGITTYNIGNTSEYSGDDFKKIKEQLPQLQSNVDNAKQLYEAAKGTNREKQREREYNQAVNELNIGKEQVNQFYDNLDVITKDKLVNNMYKFLSGWELTSANDPYQTDANSITNQNAGAINWGDLLKIAMTNNDKEAINRIVTIKHYTDKGLNVPDEVLQSAANVLTNKDYVGEIEKYQPITVDKSNSLSSPVEEFRNNNALTYATDSGIIKDNGFKDNSTTTNIALGTSRALLSSTTDLTLPNGDNFNNAISNTQKPKFFKDEIQTGKTASTSRVPTSFDMDKSDISVGMNRADGRLFLTVNPKDKEGNPIFYGESADKANKQAIQVTIGNENAAKDIYYKYAKVFDESGNPDKALEIRAEANFANTINRLVVGKDYKDPITLDMGAKGQMQFYVKGVGKESKLVSIDNPNAQPILFNDKTELKKRLETILEKQ